MIEGEGAPSSLMVEGEGASTPPIPKSLYSQSHVIILGLVCFANVWMLGPSLSAPLGPVDDWHIVKWTRGEGGLSRLRLSEVVREELAPNGGRYNPAWKLSLIAETWLVGENAFMWHADKLLLSTFCVAIVFLSARLWISPFASGLITLCYLCTTASTAWVRLGAAEVYAMPIIVFAFYVILRRLKHGKPVRPSRILPYLLLLLLTPLVKETFLTILPATFLFLYIILPLVYPRSDFSPRRFTVQDWAVSVGGALAWGGYTYYVYSKVSSNGHFYSYANQSSSAFFTSAKCFWIETQLSTQIAIPLIVAGVVIPISQLAFIRRILGLATPEHLDSKRYLCLSFATVLLFCMPQILMYKELMIDPGFFRFVGRYFQPYNLGLVILAGVAAYAIEQSLRDSSQWLRSLIVVMVALVPATAMVNAMRVNHRYARQYAAMTKDFKLNIDRVASLASIREPGQRVIVLRSYHWGEFEMIVAASYYLHARGFLPSELYYAPQVDVNCTPDWLQKVGKEGIPGLIRGGLKCKSQPDAVIRYRDTIANPSEINREVIMCPLFRF